MQCLNRQIFNNFMFPLHKVWFCANASHLCLYFSLSVLSHSDLNTFSVCMFGLGWNMKKYGTKRQNVALQEKCMMNMGKFTRCCSQFIADLG